MSDFVGTDPFKIGMGDVSSATAYGYEKISLELLVHNMALSCKL